MGLVTSVYSYTTGEAGLVYGAKVVVDLWKKEAEKHLHVHSFTRPFKDGEVAHFKCQAIVIPDVNAFFEALKDLPREHFDKIYELCGLTEKVE